MEQVPQLQRVLVGLAANPATPEEILVRLAVNEQAAERIALRRFGVLPDAVVAAILAHHDRESLVHLDVGKVSSAMRSQIGDAARNFAIEMVERGGLPVGVLENKLGVDRTVLAADPNPKIRASVAESWWDRPAEVHRALLTDPDVSVRVAASRRPKPEVPEDLHPDFLADPATRPHVARSAKLTPALAERLARDPDRAVREAVARNPELPTELCEVLLADPHPFVRAPILLHRNVSNEDRERVYAELTRAAAEGDIESTVVVEGIGRTEPEWLAGEPLATRVAYVDSSMPEFRAALARCRDLPPETWARLDNDPDWQVRIIASRRPDMPGEALERLLRQCGPGRGAEPEFVGHPNFPPDAFARFATDPEASIRQHALLDANLPTDTVDQLARDEDKYVRRDAAKHPRLSHKGLLLLLADEDGDVAEAAARRAPVSAMAEILRQLDSALGDAE